MEFSFLDAIVIVSPEEDSKTINCKDRRQASRREVQVTDDSLKIIRMYLWNNAGRDFKSEQTDVIELRGVHVSEFDGEICLKSGQLFSIVTNPNNDRAKEIKKFLELNMPTK